LFEDLPLKVRFSSWLITRAASESMSESLLSIVEVVFMIGLLVVVVVVAGLVRLLSISSSFSRCFRVLEEDIISGEEVREVVEVVVVAVVVREGVESFSLSFTFFVNQIIYFIRKKNLSLKLNFKT
jgi:hypothetical protein